MAIIIPKFTGGFKISLKNLLFAKTALPASLVFQAPRIFMLAVFFIE